MGQALSVAAAVALPVTAGFAIGIAIKDEITGWYKDVKKPSWNPPNWLFGPVWTVLYTAMGVASWLVWKNGGGPVPLTLYGIQLAMNLAWSPIFFKLHSPGWAAVDITALLGVLTATIVKFHEVSPVAGNLLLPYAAWSAFATALTYNIWYNNRSKGEPSHKAIPEEEEEESGSPVAEEEAVEDIARAPSDPEEGSKKTE